MMWIFVALAITLLLLDIWVATQALSHLAMLILAGVAASFIDTGWEWRAVVFMACYLATLAAYYLFWKQFMLWFTNTFVAPTRHQPEFENIVGAKGSVVRQKDKQFARVNGILWPIDIGTFEDGDPIQVQSMNDGKVTVQLTD